jgi:hypothetical protein
MNRKRSIGLILIFVVLLISCLLLTCVDRSKYVVTTFHRNPTKVSTQNPPPTQKAPFILSSIQNEEFIGDLYENNGGCDFPCFWGIMPGEDATQNVYDRLSSYGVLNTVIDENESKGFISFSMVPSKNIDKYTRDEWRITIGVQNDIVESIYASSEYTRGFADPVLDRYLKRLGPPEEIGIMIFPGIGSQPWYEIVLFYPKKGILVSWRGIATRIIETNYKITTSICPQNFGNEIDMVLFLPPNFVFWAPDENLSVPDVIEKYLNNQPYLMVSAENSDIAPNSFYNIYIDPETEKCFQYTLD